MKAPTQSGWHPCRRIWSVNKFRSGHGHHSSSVCGLRRTLAIHPVARISDSRCDIFYFLKSERRYYFPMRLLKHLIFPGLSLLAAGFLFLSMSAFAMEQTASSSPAPVRADGTNLWFDIRQFGVEGRGWNDTKDFYDRLPAKAEGVVRKPVWDLSRNSAGMGVRFVTDATTIRACWAVTDPWLYLPNITAIGKSGLDLYVKTDKGWHWLAVGQPTAQTNEVTLIKDLIPGKREYLLYLPLYNGTKFVQLGISATNVIEKAPAWGAGERKPIVFYGTSILQGLAASRPRMA